MNKEFIEALGLLESEKGISKASLLEAVETALLSAYKRDNGQNCDIRISIDEENGDTKILAKKTIVESVENPLSEIDEASALKISKKLSLGDIVEIDVTPKTFGRIAAQNAKQVIVQRIREVERSQMFNEFSEKKGDIVTGMVQRIEKNNIFVEIGKTEAIIPPTEQVEKERIVPGDRIKLFVVEVKDYAKGPQISLSRSHPGLVKRLFEKEVPEIFDGTVEIKGIAREAGSRTKLAVYSKNPNVDPIGACVGPKGTRVVNVLNELRNEKVDIIKWSEDPVLFIKESLAPAKVLDVKISDDDKSCLVTVEESQLSLAIGKEGQNARLAARLTGYKIDIKPLKE